MKIAWTLWIYLACMAVLATTAVYVSAIVARLNKYAQLQANAPDRPDHVGKHMYEAEVMPYSGDNRAITFRGNEMADRLFQDRTLLGVGSNQWYQVQSVSTTSNLIDDSSRRFAVAFWGSNFDIALRAGNYDSHDDIAREIQSKLEDVMVFNARIERIGTSCTASDCHGLELEVVGPGAQPFQIELSHAVKTSQNKPVFDSRTIASASDSSTPRQIARWQYAEAAGLYPPAGNEANFEAPSINIDFPLTIKLRYGSGPFQNMGFLRSGQYSSSAFVQGLQHVVRSAAPSFKNVDVTYSSNKYVFSLRNAANVDGDVLIDLSRNAFLASTLGLAGDDKTITLSSTSSSWTGRADPPLVKYSVANVRVDQDTSDVPAGVHHVLAITHW